MTTVDDRPEGGLSAGVQGPRTDPGPVGASGRDPAPDRWSGGTALLGPAAPTWLSRWSSGGNVWSSHPTSTTTCGCGDTSLMTWFLAWPTPPSPTDSRLSTRRICSIRGGVNLLANTAEVGLGVPLAPVTWLFGPVASLNVALTSAPPSRPWRCSCSCSGG